MRIEIDSQSGFCFGVVTAISKAEEALQREKVVYSLGDIVHNRLEVQRLEGLGMQTVTHEQMPRLGGCSLFIRAHGEPPSSYETAKKNQVEIIDASCPVVLNLQKKIREAYERGVGDGGQVVIYGKRGHAEVNGLVGQTDGEAIVVENTEDVSRLDFSKDIVLYSQTTKSREGLNAIEEEIRRHNPSGVFECHDTICRQVSNRMPRIRRFAASHELVLFVSGKKSSNGKILFDECSEANPNSKLINSEDDIQKEWLCNVNSIGICGATSTPRWLMANVKRRIEQILGQ